MKNSIVLLLTLTALAFAASPAAAFPTDLDESFGKNGVIEVKEGELSTEWVGFQPRASGTVEDVILVGSGDEHEDGGYRKIFVARYNSETGLLDKGFGSNGMTKIALGGGYKNNPNIVTFSVAAAIQPDRKIVLAWPICIHITDVTMMKKLQPQSPSPCFGYAVMRLLPNGTPDLTFGGWGKVGSSIGQGPIDEIAKVNAVLTRPDGKMTLVLHHHFDNQGKYGSLRSDIAMVRYNPSGKLDTTFGVNGKVVTKQEIDWINAVQVQRVGGEDKILVVENGGSVRRFDDDGGLDPSFGPVWASSVMVVDSGGGIVTGLFEDEGFCLVRYEPDGNVSGKFGQLCPFDEGVSINVTDKGKLLAAGFSDGQLAIASLLWSGQLDKGFGQQGKAVLKGNFMGSLITAFFQHDGKFVTGWKDGGNLSITRYLGATSP